MQENIANNFNAEVCTDLHGLLLLQKNVDHRHMLDNKEACIYNSVTSTENPENTKS